MKIGLNVIVIRVHNRNTHPSLGHRSSLHINARVNSSLARVLLLGFWQARNATVLTFFLEQRRSESYVLSLASGDAEVTRAHGSHAFLDPVLDSHVLPP